MGVRGLQLLAYELWGFRQTICHVWSQAEPNKKEREREREKERERKREREIGREGEREKRRVMIFHVVRVLSHNHKKIPNTKMGP